MALFGTDQDEKLSVFLGGFPTPLHYYQPSILLQWVFWSEDDRSQNNSSSVDPATLKLYKDIISALCALYCGYYNFIVQVWAPVTIGGKRLLSTSGQPFAVSHDLRNNLKKYRLHSMEYQYDIDDANMQLCNIDDEEEELRMILHGEPASAFLNRLPEVVSLRLHQESPLARYASKCELMTSIMLPIYSPSQPSSCIAVLEVSVSQTSHVFLVQRMKKKVEAVGLGVFDVEERIPYKAINSLRRERKKITPALKKICKWLDLDLAQVWIACEDVSHVPFSSFVEAPRTKQMIALKLTGCLHRHIDRFRMYYDISNTVCLRGGVESVEKTLQDYKPRFSKNVKNQCVYATLISTVKIKFGQAISGLVICLRSIDTGNFDYAFEFIWVNRKRDVVNLEELLSKLKELLPSFKFASGAELGDELDVINVENPTDTEIKTLKIFQGKKVSPMPDALEKGNKPMVVSPKTPSEVKYKTAPKFLPKEVIKQQFGNTMKEAAENIKVSLSTLKRKCKEFDICEWQGRPKVVKRKTIDSCNYQSNRNEDDNGAIHESSVINRNENTLTIKAMYGDDIIKFTIHISEATFATIENEISKGFEMNHGTYKLKYLDEDKDMILLTSDQGIRDCIKSMRILGQTVVRLLVIPATQYPSSYEIS